MTLLHVIPLHVSTGMYDSYNYRRLHTDDTFVYIFPHPYINGEGVASVL